MKSELSLYANIEGGLNVQKGETLLGKITPYLHEGKPALLATGFSLLQGPWDCAKYGGVKDTVLNFPFPEEKAPETTRFTVFQGGLKLEVNVDKFTYQRYALPLPDALDLDLLDFVRVSDTRYEMRRGPLTFGHVYSEDAEGLLPYPHREDIATKHAVRICGLNVTYGPRKLAEEKEDCSFDYRIQFEFQNGPAANRQFRGSLLLPAKDKASGAATLYDTLGKLISLNPRLNPRFEAEGLLELVSRELERQPGWK